MNFPFSNIFRIFKNLNRFQAGIFVLFFYAVFGFQACIVPQTRGGYPSDYVYKGDINGLERAVRFGHSVNTRDPFTLNYTPLMIAAREGETAIAEFLIRNGADVNAKTRDGHTALMMAVYNRNIEIVELLLRSGADTNVKTKQGHTAWSEATLEDSKKIKDLLLSAGVGRNE